MLTERMITKLLKSFKTEINPTAEQKNKINRTIGTCRFVYNFYLAHNREIYERANRFVSGYDFSIWLNNDYIPNNPEFAWIKEVSSKSVKQSIMNAQKAFKNFFDEKANFPKWKKKSNSENNLKGEAAWQNIRKQKLKVQKLYHRLGCIRTDYLNKAVSELVKTKPKWITLEDLNVRGMMKNKHLSKAVAQQKFFEFRTKLTAKCKEYGIELRLVDRFYPSSKLCHKCGCIKSDLKLSDRTYTCSECGYTADRDFNASLNLRDCLTYQIA